MSAATPERMVPCPACGMPALFGAANPWRPFCSKRCRTTDLGAWASESYRIATHEQDEAGGGPEDTEP